ncbi:MAG: FHIPEP family type III secretion protein [Armatimonadota bacterium]
MRNPVTLTNVRSIASAGIEAGPQLLGAALAAGALLALLLPLPALLVDLLLALSLGAATGVLVVSLATSDPLNLTSMPPLLVLSSLGRIVLCLCISRMILIDGQAGTLVPTLGAASAGADAIAGLGVLIVLAIVQVVMVTSGVGRMAEVAARFALDALPGKQMGLDTAVSAGQMPAREARAEVRRLEREANFYAAMDGAGRLLRGEAIATVVIVALSALAGITRGVGGDAALGDALGRYVMLATGQGLVTLLPALIMAAAAALMVSRSAGSLSLAGELGSQMLVSPWPLVAAAITLVGLGLFPGVARLPTLLGGALLAGGAWWLSRTGGKPPSEGAPVPSQQDAGVLSLELGMGLLDLLEDSAGLMEALPDLRARASRELGFDIPPVMVRDSLELGATEYAIVLRSGVLARGRIRPGRTLAVAPHPGATPDIGTAAELADGRTGVWVNRDEADELGGLGFVLMTAVEALTGDLQITLRRHAADIFDLEQAAALLAGLRRSHPALVEAADAAGLDAGLLRRVCGELLWGGVPLRDPVSVVGGVVEALSETRDVERLALRVRPRLAGMISDCLMADGKIRAVFPSPELQEELAASAHREEDRTIAAMMPARSAAWVVMLDQFAAEHGWGQPLAAIAEPGSLMPLQSLCRRASAQYIAVRAVDLSPNVELEYVARPEPDQLT